MADAHTVSWAPACHFLLVTIDGDKMTVRAVGDVDSGGLQEIERRQPDEGRVVGTDRSRAGLIVLGRNPNATSSQALKAEATGQRPRNGAREWHNRSAT